MNKKCTGCGIKLQNKNKDLIGYVDELEKDICQRCFKLSNYGKFKKVSLTNKDYLKIIDSIPKETLILYVTDILDLNLDNIDKFSKVILVVTKRDVLPKSIVDEKIIKYIKIKYQNIIEVILVSSIHNYNLDALYNTIIKYQNDSFIYIVGSTNSGKSTLMNKLIKNYSSNELRVTTSIYPSTTLDKIEIKIGELTIIDTPGLINEHSLINNLSPEELKKITPKKEIKPKSCQIKGKGSLIIDKYIRIDYETSSTTSLVIYVSNALEVRFSSLKKEVPQDYVKTEFNLLAHKDIVMPGLGFIKFIGPIKVNIYCERNLKPYTRDNLI